MELEIFTVTAGKLDLNKPFLYTIPAFKNLLARDKDRFKKRAGAELLYVYTYCDPKALLSGKKEQEIIDHALKVSAMDPSGLEDELVAQAVDAYGELLEEAFPSLPLLKKVKKSYIALGLYFDSIDFTDTIDGKPVYEVTDYVKNLKALKDAATYIKEFEEKVRSEMDASSGLRGKHERGYREVPTGEESYD